MKIRTLRARNVCERTFSHELGDVNLFTGPNRSGKSARLHAVTLALLGYLPKLGKQTASTFKLAGTAGQMGVTAKLDNEFVLGREWKRGRNRIETSCDIPTDFPETPSVMLDAKVYFDLSSEKRLQFVFEKMKLADVEELNPSTLVTDLKKIKVEEQTDRHTAALDEIVSEIMDSARERHSLAKGGDEIPLQDWIEEQVGALETRISDAKAAVDRHAKKLASDAELQQQNPTTAPLNTEEQEAQIEQLRREIAEYQQKRGGVTQVLSVWNAEDRKRQDARLKLASLGDIDTRIQNAEQRVSDTRKAIEGYVSKTAALTADKEAADKDLRDIEVSLSRVTAELKSIEQQIVDASSRISRRNALTTRLENLHDRTGEITALRKQIDDVTAEINGYQSETGKLKAESDAKFAERQKVYDWIDLLEKKPCCPTCRRDFAVGAEEMKAQANEENKRVQGELEKVHSAYEVSVKRDNEISERKKHLATLKQQLTNAEDGQRSRDAVTNELGGIGEIPDHAAKRDKLCQERDVLNDNAKPLRERVVELSNALTNSRQADEAHNAGKDAAASAETQLAALQADKARIADLQAIANALMTTNPADDIGACDRAINSRTEAIANLNRIVTASLAAKNEEKRRKEAVEEKAKAEAEYAIATLARECVRDFRDKLISHAFGGILGKVNSIFVPVLGVSIEYRENEIGYWEGPKWISHETFSGSEEALLFCSLSVALAIEAPCKIVVLDELRRLSDENLHKFIEVMVRLTGDGTIDQFIGALPSAPTSLLSIAGVNLITLNPK